jgi:hypothetical protein
LTQATPTSRADPSYAAMNRCSPGERYIERNSSRCLLEYSSYPIDLYSSPTNSQLTSSSSSITSSRISSPPSTITGSIDPPPMPS